MNLAEKLKIASTIQSELEGLYERANLEWDFYKKLKDNENPIVLIAPEKVLSEFMQELVNMGFSVSQGDDKTNCTVNF